MKRHCFEPHELFMLDDSKIEPVHTVGAVSSFCNVVWFLPEVSLLAVPPCLGLSLSRGRNCLPGSAGNCIMCHKCTPKLGGPCSDQMSAYRWIT